jgi:hypothetical protein
MPRKVEATRLAKPLMSKNPEVVGVKIFAANNPGAVRDQPIVEHIEKTAE